MTERGDLRRNADGFVDMDQFDATDPADARDDATSGRLHDLLVRAPVPVPSTDRFDELVTRVLEQDSAAPDTAGLVPDDQGPLEDDSLEVPATDDPAAPPEIDRAGGAGDIDSWGALDGPADEPGGDPGGGGGGLG